MSWKLSGGPHMRFKDLRGLWWSLQDPFCLVPKQFQGQLEPRDAKALASALANINLDLFLIELHEMIMVALSRFEPHYE